jgi:hypothetical protein
LAQILGNGLIQFNDGRILYSDTPITGQDFMELQQLLPQINSVIGRAAIVGFPFISGGGGGGSPGARGVDGQQGVTGIAGGGTGLQGATGLQGVTGPGAGSQGTTGVQGPQGLTGVAGATGIQGQTGVRGQTGIQGQTGVQGATGAQGVTGIQGATGIQGTTGVQGSTGFQGVTGAQGLTGVGSLNVAIFNFTHTSGTAGTGALGFTPKFAIYTGAVQVSDTEVSIATGFAIGTTTNARSNAFGYNQGSGSPIDPGGSAAYGLSSIGGHSSASQGSAQFVSISRDLDVSAFSAAGIDLTWASAVTSHEGNLLVVG